MKKEQKDKGDYTSWIECVNKQTDPRICNWQAEESLKQADKTLTSKCNDWHACYLRAQTCG